LCKLNTSSKTLFTVSEPTELMGISPIIYELAGEEQKEILENTFDVAPFEIGIVKLLMRSEGLNPSLYYKEFNC